MSTKPSKYLSILLNNYRIKGNRLAIVSERILSETSNNDTSTLTKNLFNLTDFYKDKNLSEFDWRLVLPVEKMFGELTETLNVISIIKRSPDLILEFNAQTGPQQKFNYLTKVTQDINTLPTNTSERFDQTNIKPFFTSAVAWFTELRTQINTVINLK